MKNQAIFSSKKDKSKKSKCRLLQFLFGVLRVKGLRTLPPCQQRTQIGVNGCPG